jgi:ribosome-binding factor A
MIKNDVVYDQFQRKKIKIEIYIKHIIANFLLFNITDNNILRESYVTIIKVRISPDLREAIILFTVRENIKPKLKSINKALTTIIKDIKNIISKNMKLRFIPNLKFKYDKNFDEANKVCSIIQNINPSQ